MAALEALRHLPQLTCLDSAMQDPALGRYTFIAADPFATFKVIKGQAYWNGKALQEAPLDALRTALHRYRQESDPDLPPFQGGAAGYIAYDFGQRLEVLPTPQEDIITTPEMVFHFYDCVLAIDHVEKTACLIATGWPEETPHERLARAKERTAFFRDLLEKAQEPPVSDMPAISGWQANFTQPAYEAAIARTVDYVLAGDIFQANIAQRFRATLPDHYDPLAFYVRLRTVNAATFAAYLAYDDVTLCSASPERFITIRDSKVETRPIKGTRPRGGDPESDQTLADDLLTSVKDRAENVMIVDLLRNDLSRVCKPGSVQVPALCALESYASVHHLVSTVTGELEEGKDALDMLGASFPGGSITGAPKIRAMEIITELERIQRNAYCGVIGYLGFDGAMDTNIAIRTVQIQGNHATFTAGGGITALSDPAEEYQESLDKAARIFEAFGTSLEAEGLRTTKTDKTDTTSPSLTELQPDERQSA